MPRKKKQELPPNLAIKTSREVAGPRRTHLSLRGASTPRAGRGEAPVTIEADVAKSGSHAGRLH